MQFGNLGSLRAGNDLVVKIYWPEESGTSEMDILRKAKEYGEKIDFIGNHIPEMFYHQDPNFLCSSTGTICRFIGLPTDGSRRLRVIVLGHGLCLIQVVEALPGHQMRVGIVLEQVRDTFDWFQSTLRSKRVCMFLG
jgi:hypothetical protein